MWRRAHFAVCSNQSAASADEAECLELHHLSDVEQDTIKEADLPKGKITCGMLLWLNCTYSVTFKNMFL